MSDRRNLLLIGLVGLVGVAFAFIAAIVIVSRTVEPAQRTAAADAAARPTTTDQPTPAPTTPPPTAAPTATPLPTPTPTPDPVPVGEVAQDVDADDWMLVFADDFDRLDTSMWETGWFSSSGFSPAVNGSGAACFHPDQLSTADGVLALSIDESDDADCRLKDGSASSFVGGLLNTRETFTFSYGYAEARMFLANDGGPLHNWPAFWHTGFDWPLTGEVDIAEGLTDGVLCSVYHHQGDDGPVQERGCVDWPDPGGWHVFGADWQPERIIFYYDGIEVFSTTEGVVGSPHYLIVNYTVRDDGSAVVPSEMLVDYVRVWQVDPAG